MVKRLTSDDNNTVFHQKKKKKKPVKRLNKKLCGIKFDNIVLTIIIIWGKH